jgi:hypothetical protein
MALLSSLLALHFVAWQLQLPMALQQMLGMTTSLGVKNDALMTDDSWKSPSLDVNFW